MISGLELRKMHSAWPLEFQEGTTNFFLSFSVILLQPTHPPLDEKFIEARYDNLEVLKICISLR